MLAAVYALEQPAARPARTHAPRLAPGFPQRCVDDFRVLGIDRDVDRAAIGISIEDLAPGRAAVARLVHAAIWALTAVAPESADQDFVAIVRVNADAREVLHRLEADIFPRLARVGRFVDAVSGHDVAAKLGLASCEIHYIRVGFAHCDAADRAIV